MPPLVIDVMEGFRDRLLADDLATRNEMLHQWLLMERSLQSYVDLLSLEISSNWTPPYSIYQLMQMSRTRDLMQQIWREVDRYQQYVEPLIVSRQRDLALRGISNAFDLVQASAADQGIFAQFARLPVSTIERFVGLTGDGSPLHDILVDASQTGPAALQQILLEGLTFGENPYEVARRAVRQGLGRSLVRFATIARTETMRVYRKTTLESFRASPSIVGYRRVASKSRRTCMACLALDGMEYALETEFEQHVNCRCTLIPIIRGEEPIHFVNGRIWFEQQSEAIQREMLGPAKYELWRDGRIGWDDLYFIERDPTWGDAPQETSVQQILEEQTRV